MSNKYFSVERRFQAKAWTEQALNLNPAKVDVTIAAGSYELFVGVRNDEVSENTNIIIVRTGNFSNYADGLVLKEAGDFIHVKFRAFAFTLGAVLSGTVTFNAGTKSVTAGAGTGAFVAEAPAGTRITDGVYVYEVAQVINNDSLLTREYIPVGSAPATPKRVATQVGTDNSFRLIELNMLNTFVPVEDFIVPSSFLAAGITSIDLIGVEAQVFVPVNYEYLTTSISADFHGETVFFDLPVDLEYTKR